MSTLSDFTATAIDGTEQSLSAYAGDVVVVVNTASQCGFTAQYGPLQEVYSALHGRGLDVLGFPCDQFGHQEPGTDAEISDFCETSYGVTFPMFSKIEVNGPQTAPLYEWLKSERPGILGGAIKWNFTKFLIDRQGKVVQRYAPQTNPAELVPDIERLL